ncbi:MAG TPA: hypothetical protein VH085_07680 [Nocardioides sp.]|jgi:hypothetical protein|nr:hypothetical protein [Nocardioides sp.]
MTWTDDELLDAVRRALAGARPAASASGQRGPLSRSWDFAGADVVHGAIRVFFTVGPNRWALWAVDYSLDDLPAGPNTGAPCDSAAEWAGEIWTDMDEQIDTGALLRAQRSIGPDGVALVRWR